MNEYIKELAKVFPEIYGFIYDNNDKIPGYRFMINLFDNRLKTDSEFKALVEKFNEYRHDFISSDREAAAFMFAIAECAE